MKKLVSAVIYTTSISCFLLLIASGISFIIHLFINAEAHFFSGTLFLISLLAFWITGVLLNMLSNQQLVAGERRLHDSLAETKKPK